MAGCQFDENFLKFYMITQTQIKLTNARQKAMTKWIQLMNISTTQELPLKTKPTAQEFDKIKSLLKIVNQACDQIDDQISKAI